MSSSSTGSAFSQHRHRTRQDQVELQTAPLFRSRFLLLQPLQAFIKAQKSRACFKRYQVKFKRRREAMLKKVMVALGKEENAAENNQH
ncbi:hypothetical protein RIF29_21197 [Crotalaria pallida]|uniref:Uncharacterized protein n=1 Tax=Crotalaria pallida TaxID=3830 RepID=A0AAN9F6X1_CROPI